MSVHPGTTPHDLCGDAQDALPRNAQIIALRKGGLGPREIARRLDVSPGCVAGVLFRAEMTADGETRRRALAENAARPRLPRPSGEKNPLAKLTDQDVRDMRLLRRAGLSLKTLAANYGVHFSMVSHVCSGKRWSHVQ